MSNDKLFRNTRYCISQWLVKSEDSLPEASLGFRSILLQIQFVNQAFLGLQFFQVQGRNQALEQMINIYWKTIKKQGQFDPAIAVCCYPANPPFMQKAVLELLQHLYVRLY